MDLNGKVAVVTGGASGIGAACGEAFSSLGAKVALADVNEEGAQAVAGRIGGLGILCNVGEEADINSLVRRVERELGPVDIFFSNAGIGAGGGPLEASLGDWQAQWQVNVMAHVYAVRAVLPGMLERRSGYLLHTASMAGILTNPGNAVYSATKHAVVGLAEWLAITYHDRGVRTSLLAPLAVRTPMLGDNPDDSPNSAIGPIREPEEVAQQVVEAMSEERFLILTDPIAQTWMDRKASDLDRWLRGMRRMVAGTTPPSG